MPDSSKPNLCKYDGILSKCGSTTWEKQKDCRYREKSGRRVYCIFFSKEYDGHCSNIEAQKNASGR